MRNDVQTSINLALGSIIASIGLTIPVIAIFSVATGTELELGLPSASIGLFVLSMGLGILTLIPGHAIRLLGGLHIIICCEYVALTIWP